MIPANLTNKELGLWLQAVGQQMSEQDLLFAAALDGLSYSRMFAHIAIGLNYWPTPADERRVAEILLLTDDDLICILEGTYP